MLAQGAPYKGTRLLRRYSAAHVGLASSSALHNNAVHVTALLALPVLSTIRCEPLCCLVWIYLCIPRAGRPITCLMQCVDWRVLGRVRVCCRLVRGVCRPPAARFTHGCLQMEACYSVIDARVHIHLSPEYFNNIKVGVQVRKHPPCAPTMRTHTVTLTPRPPPA